MFKQSVHSTLIAGSLASKFLKENGLLTLAGAAAALDATPGSSNPLHTKIYSSIKFSSFRYDRLWRSQSCYYSYWQKSCGTKQWHAKQFVRLDYCTVRLYLDSMSHI